MKRKNRVGLRWDGTDVYITPGLDLQVDSLMGHGTWKTIEQFAKQLLDQAAENIADWTPLSPVNFGEVQSAVYNVLYQLGSTRATEETVGPIQVLISRWRQNIVTTPDHRLVMVIDFEEQDPVVHEGVVCSGVALYTMSDPDRVDRVH